MGVFSAFVNTAKRNSRARFVLVNGRVPRHGAFCALCGSGLVNGYIREQQTRRLFCDTWCIAEEARIAVVEAKKHSRKVS
jgi:hypothetical protein